MKQNALFYCYSSKFRMTTVMMNVSKSNYCYSSKICQLAGRCSSKEKNNLVKKRDGTVNT